MTGDLSADEYAEILRREGWSAVEVSDVDGWFVRATNGPASVDAWGRTRAEAWREAARAAGKAREGTGGRRSSFAPNQPASSRNSASDTGGTPSCSRRTIPA